MLLAFLLVAMGMMTVMRSKMQKEIINLELKTETLRNELETLTNTNEHLEKVIKEFQENSEELLKEKQELMIENEELKEDIEALRGSISKQKSVTISKTSRGNGGTTKDFTATSYDLSVDSCGKRPEHSQYGVTRSGFSLKGMSRTEAMSIAVDPNVIPLGTQVHVEFLDAEYSHFTGVYTARDTGGAIKGKIIDIFMGDFNSIKSHQSVIDFGRRKVRVTY